MEIRVIWGRGDTVIEGGWGREEFKNTERKRERESESERESEIEGKRGIRIGKKGEK